MVVGVLPWNEIQSEVLDAVCRYLADVHGEYKRYISIPRLVDYIQSHPHRNLQPHLYDLPWDAVEYRCGKTIRDIGWVKFSRGVYVVPDEIEGMVRMTKMRMKVQKAARA